MPIGIVLDEPLSWDAVICIDDHNLGQLKGRLYDKSAEEVSFFGVERLALAIEERMTVKNHPMAAFEMRGFKKKVIPTDKINKEVKGAMQEKEQEIMKGDNSTFVVKIQYRQNATWQGTIDWIEGKKSQKFRSTLELIKLMDDAVGAYDEADEAIDW